MTPTPERPESHPDARQIARLRWRALLNRNPCALLLFVQLAGVLLYPFIETLQTGNPVFGAFGVLVLVLTIAMVRSTAGRAWISATLAVPAVLLNILHATLHMPALLPWAATLEALFYFHAAWCLVVYMLDDRRATSDELFAAGATFTLLAWGFTFVFVACQAVQPGAFGGTADHPRSWTELMFLSFVLLSSTGIGDVVPITSHARALASVEIFVGIMYLALVVSRLIGLTVLSREQR